MTALASVERGVVWLFLNRVMLFVTGYALYIVLGRFLLTPQQFGVFGLMVSMLFLLGMVFTTGLQQSVSKFVSESNATAGTIKRQVLKFAFVLSLFLFLAVFLLAPTIALALNDSSLIPYIQMAAFVPLFQPIVSVFFGYLNGMKRFKEQALHSIFYRVCRMIFPIALVLLGASLFGAIAGLSIALFVYLLFAFPLLGVGKGGKFPMRAFVLFAVPLTVFAVVLNAFMVTDLFLLKALSPVGSANLFVGHYVAAQTISRIPFDLAGVFSVVLLPLMSAAVYGKQRDKTLFYLRNAYRYSFMLVAPIAAIIFSTAPSLITLFYGEAYLPGSTALSFLSVGFVFFTMFLISATALAAKGKPHLAALIGFLALVLDVGLLFYLIPAFSLLGAAYATLISMFVASILAGGWVFTHFPIFPFKAIVRISIAAILVAVASLAYPVAGLLLVVKVILLFGLFALLLFVLGEFKKEDLTLAANAFL